MFLLLIINQECLKTKKLSKLLAENKGVHTDIFYLPPFQLHQGEIIGIFVGNHEHTYLAERHITNIFTEKIQDKNVSVREKFTFVDYVWESAFRRIFFPITVGEYLKKHADLKNPYAKKIYETEWINRKTNINRLPGNPRKLLSLYSVLSKKENIILDFGGQDPQGARTAFEIIRKECNEGGSAILFDLFKSIENDCDQYIKLEWLIEATPTSFKNPFV
ncbi:MAG TPA: hypothetical protein DEO71_05850 [Chryseobacterium sp.]|nr:hypothetical protein [Chryseobacterium sp.]